MADNENTNNPLNDAKENISTNDASTDSKSAQERQNQQSTTANTVATGAETLQDDIAAQSASGEEGGSSGVQEESDSQRGAPVADASGSGSDPGSAAQSQVMPGGASQAEEGADTGAGGSGAGAPQSVGGEAAEAQSGESEGATQAAAASSGGAAAGQAPAAETEHQDFDSETVSETFEVNVEDTGEGGTESVQDDFDTETVSETFEVQVEDTNDGPVAEDLAYTINEDGTLTFTDEQLLAGASDIDGDQLIIEGVNYSGPDGVLTVNGDGTYTFAPNENFTGEVDLSFTVSDGTESVQANIDITVTPENDAPVSGDLAYSVDEDGAITLSQEQLLSQASDVEGDALTASNLSAGDNATAVENDDGSFTITPDADFNGDIDLSFDISDGTDTIVASADLTVNPVNDLPSAEDKAYTIEEDGSLTFTDEQLLAGASDIDGDDLSVADVSYSGADGVFTDNGDGSYTFSPNENFSGEVQLSFSVSDGTDTVDASIDVTVTEVNDPPVAGSTSYQVDEDNVLTFSEEQLLANSSDVEGDVAVQDVSYSGTDGILTDNGDGSYSFAPNENFNGDVSLGVTVVDEDGASAETTAGIEVIAVNDAPVSGDLAYSVDEDGAITLSQEQLLSQASDVEGDALTASNLSAGDNATVTENDDGSFTITPDADFNGDIDLSFDISDGTDTIVASADLTVNPVNDLPSAEDKAYTIEEDGSLTFTDEQLLAGASDIDGDDLSVADVSYSGADGVFTDNGDGSYTFSPNENFSGEVELSFSVSDGTDTVDASIDVTVTEVNDPPVAGSTSYQVDEDNVLTFSSEQLLANSSDVEGDVAVQDVSYSGTDGILADNGDGSYSFAPNENFNGDVSLDVTVVDEDGATAETTAGIEVIAVNDAPVSGDLAYSVDEDGAITLSQEQLLSQASDVEGDELSASNLSAGDNATVVDNGDGSFTITPDADFNGDIDLSFDISDGTDSIVASADLTVNPVNDLPSAEDKAYTIEEDGSLTFTDEQLLAGANDIDGDDLSIADVSYSGADGVFTDNGDGSYTFSPNENFSGGVELSFSVSDGTDNVDASIDVTVTEVNDPPVAGSTSYQVDEDNVLTFSEEQLLANSSDVEGDVAVQDVSYSGTDGILTDNGDGSYSFAPNENFNGDVSLDVTVVDEDGATAETNAGIEVIAVNDAPVSGDLAYSVDEDGAITLSQEQLLSQASDVEGDELSASNLSAGDNATVVDNGDGSFTITPDADFNGDIDLSFDVSDGTDSIVATAYLTVNPVNDLPSAEDKAYTIEEDGSLTFTDEQLLAGASDIDGDELSVADVSYSGADGVFTDNGDGSYTFSPNENFSGEVELSFSVSDGTDTVDASIDVTVTEVNDPPVAGSTSYQVNEDNSITISDEQLLANSSDIEGDVAVQDVSYSGTDGVFADNGDGSYTFTSNENFSGDISIDVTIVDEAGATADTTAGIEVIEVNDPPIAGPTSYTIDEDSVLTFSESQVLGNASDIEGDVELVGISYDGPDGVFSVNGDGTCSFAPNENFNGEVQLNVTIQDEDGATVDTVINVEVLPINDAPVSGDLAYSVDEDGAITLSQEQLLSQASDVEGDALTASNLSAGDNATVVENDDGSFTITADADFNGDIDLSFDISDGTDTIVASADLTVNPVNDLPSAEDKAYTIEEDGSLTFTDEQLLAGASDIDGDDLSVADVSYSGADGVFTDNGDGSYTFSPNENFSGEVELSFSVSDGTDTVDASIDVSVTEVNDPPVAGSTSYQVDEDNVLTFSEEQLLANSSDVEGDVAVQGVSYSGTDGIFTDNGDGSYSFAPNENFNGDVSLDVTVVDEDGATAETTAGIEVIAVNDAPVSGDLAYSVDEDGAITLSQAQLLSQASDVEGDALTAPNLSAGDNATVVEHDDGSFTITPDADFNGDIDLSFDISDGTDTIVASADLTVNPVNDLPGAEDKLYYVEEDGSLTFTDEQLLAGASDIDGDDLSVADVSYSGADGVFTDNGDGSYTFSPNENFSGEVELSFSVSDGTDTVGANIDIVVTESEVNNPPVAGATSYSVDEDNVLTFSDAQLLANSSDIEGDVAVQDVSYSGTDGILTDNGDGSYSFAPNENFNGDVSLDVVVVDEDGATAETTAGIEVIAVNDAPVSDDLAYSVDEDGAITLSQEQLLSQASDVEGDALTASNLSAGDNATVVENDDGSFTITPDADFNGDIDLSFDISDGTDSIVANADLTVNPVNDLPSAEDKAYTIEEDGSLTFTDEQLLAGASDIDGDDLSVADVSYSGADGVFTDNGDGSYTFSPNENFSGEVELSFSVSDGTDTVDASLDVTVTEVNDPPVAGSTSYQVDEDNVLTFSEAQLLANSSDVEGDVAVQDVSYSGTDGILTDNGDGSYSFAPNENFNGDVSLDVTVVDEGGATAETTAGIEVIAVNDPPVAGSTAYTMDEDGAITLTEEQLLANSSDVEGDVSVSEVSYSGDDGTFSDNGDGTFSFAPSENWSGEVSLDVTVVDEDGASSQTTAGITVIAVNDAPDVSGVEAVVDEDHSITLTQEQLLANASDIEGDQLTATNLQTNDPNATIVENDDGSYTITHTENFNGDIDFTFDVSDGVDVVATTLDLTVNPVNDAPDAGDEIFIQAEEDQTVGVSLREEPVIRLDQAPEFGIVEANIDDEWVQLEVGREVPADTEVRFVPDEDAVSQATHDSQIGTFDDNATLDDWGTAVDDHTRQFVDGDLTVTTQSSDGPLGAWNGKTHIGRGIGDDDRNGLSNDEQLVVTVEGKDINEISFELDGLGGWFLEDSPRFTEVEIRAFNADGELIDSETYHKDDKNSYEHTYTLTTDEPVSHFELGTIQGSGTYVVQNMTVSQTQADEVVFTTIGVDGTEVTETIDLNLHNSDADVALDLTADLPSLEVSGEGAESFASIVITEEQLLAQASDIDSDVLDIQNLELVGDDATLTDNGDGTWTVTPDPDFHGEVELTYEVTDGELVDSNTININFESVNDEPIVSGPVILSTEEDNSITFTDEDLLANASDIEGDDLSISNISYNGDNGELTDNGDGSYTFVPNENFNGEVDLDYQVFDGTDAVDAHVDLTVIPVNDVPEPGAPLSAQMLENGSMQISVEQLLANASDVDGDILHIENLLLADQTQGTLQDNGDNTFTFTPAEDFSGEVQLTFDVSDGIASAPNTMNIDVEEVNFAPDVSGPLDASVDEDGSITLTQEDLLANASDIDGDALAATNLSTNDPNATIVENGDGSFTITPSENFFGEVEFSYDVTDGIETVATGLDLTVNPVNDLPDVPDLVFNTMEDESLTVTTEQLLAQASDIEGDELSVLNLSTEEPNASVVDNGDGSYTITPSPEFDGQVNFTFDVSDGTDVVQANLELNVEFVNDAPEAEAVAAQVDEDNTILVTQEMLLENASDVDGDILYADNLQTNDPNATVVDNGDGTYSVTPSEDFYGDIQFTYDVSDGEIATPTELNLTVNPVNDAPEVAPVSFEMQEDGSLLISDEVLLANATDIEGDALSVDGVSYSGDQGELVDNGDGTYSFNPAEHFSGDVQLEFSVSDGTDSVTQSIDVAIGAVADAPDLSVTDADGQDLSGQTIEAEQGETVELNIAAELVDQDLSETLSVEVNGVPEGTVIRYDNESVLNDQDSGITSYNDTEITVTFEGETAGFKNAAGYYKVDDEGNITDVEIVYENASQVGGGGDLVPGETSFSFNIEEGESFNLFVVPNGFNRNNFDEMQDGHFEFRMEDGSSATMDSVDPQLVFVGDDGEVTVVQSQFGDAIFHGGTSENLNQDGIEHTRTGLNEDGELVYGIEDLYGGGDRDFSDFNFTIDVGELNSQIFSGEVTAGAEGSVVLPTIALDQTLELDFPEGFSGGVDLVVEATATELSNDDEASVSQTIHIDVQDYDPTAESVSATVEEDRSITVTQEDLLANASDVDGDDLTALNLSTNDENATVVANDDGSFTITPSEDFHGDIQFSYDVSDGDDIVATELNLTVTPVNDAPEAEDKAYTIEEDGSLTFTDEQLLAGASDIDGDDLSVADVSYSGADGVFTDNGDGSYTFSPNENFSGEVELSFSVSDGTDTVDASIDVTVTEVNDPPVAGSTSYQVDEDNVLTFSEEQLLANSSDVEGDVAVQEVSYSGTDGILTDNGDGSYSFAPNENFNGDVSLEVTVVDEDGATAETTAGIEVIAVNDAPVSGDLAYSVDEDGAITLSQEQLLSQASDVEGDALTASNLRAGDNATVTENDDGSFTITPDADFNGDIDLSFDISDGTDSIVASADLTVNPVNDLPSAEDKAYIIEEDGSLTFTDEQLLAGASDIDGDDLSVADVSYSGADGVFADNGDGSYTFSPNENFSGEIELSFSVSDGTDTVDASIDVTVTEVNDPPVAGSTSYQVDEDNVLVFSEEQLLANSSDVEGDVAVQDVSYSGTDGILTDNGDGSYSFAPNENFNGDVSLEVTVVDEDGATAETTAGIEVIAVNDAPVSGDLAYSVDEDGAITLSQEQLLSQASDVEGDALTASNLSAGDNASVTENDDGSFTITPDADFNGDIDLSFDISDGTDTVVASADLTVNPVNDLPSADDKAYTVEEDGSLTFTDEQLLAGASDIDGDELSVADVSYSGADGVFTDNGDGSYTFSPNENFSGEVELSFSVSDGTDTVDASIDMTVTEVNDPPVAGSTSYQVNEDNSITISDEQLLANSSDIEGDVAVHDVSYSGTEGVFADNGDGSYTFTPNENFSGDISLDVTIVDEAGATADTTAGIEVIEVNDPPIAGPTSYTIDEDSVLTFSESQVLGNASDIEGDVELVGISYDGPDGVFSVNGDGTCSFAPNENFNGEVQLNVTIQDEDGATVDTVINVDVLPINDAPVSGDLAYSVSEDGAITLSQEQLLSQASDVEGDALTASNLSAGDNTTVTENDDGSFTITPDADFNGDIDLSFDISDGTDSIVATADLTVNPVNDLPSAEDKAYTVEEDGSLTFTDEQLLAGASDIDGDDLSVADVSYSGADGVFTDNGDGSYTFSPNENFSGEVELSFSVSDGTDTVDASIDVTVTEVNDPPVAGSTSYQVDEDNVLTFSEEQLLANSSDVEGDVAVQDVSYSGTDGILTDNGDGSYSFAPNENFNGDVSLDVTVVDEDGATAETTAGIEVIAVNDAPVSGDLAYSVDEDGAITLSQEQLLSQASDVEGDALTASNLSAGDNASVTENDDGSFTITPDADFNGDIDLSFDISDGTDSIVASADLTVNPVNDLPSAEDKAYTIEEDGSLTFTDEQLLAGASDIDGDDLSVADVSYSGADGVFTDNGDGSYTFSPNENFSGDVELSFSVSDGTDTVDASIDVTVTEVNDPPVAGSTSYQVNEDNSITISDEQLLANSSDIEGDVAVEDVSYSGTDGVFADNGDGSYTFTPNENFSGDISLDVTIVDEDGATADTTAGIEVIEVNDPPIAGPTSYSIDEDSVLTFSESQVLGNASDIEGDVELVGISYDGPDGVFSVNGDGTCSFAPNENFNGEVQLNVTIQDEDGATVDTVINVDVLPINDAPVSGDLAYSVDEDGAITLSQEQLLSQASDVEGDALTASNLSAGDNATVTENDDGSFTITPDADFHGDIDLSFDISDGTDTIVASADLTVNPVNDLPSAEDKAYTIEEDGSLTFTDEQLLAGASDIDGDDLSVADVSYSGADGVFTDNGDGSYTFSPNENFSGDVELSFSVSDGTDTVDASIDVIVTEVNDPPVAGSTSYQVDEDNVLTFSEEQLLANSSDVEGDVVVQDVSYSGTDGILTDNGDGSYSFAPNENFNGDVSLDVVVVDEDGATAETTAGIEVIAANDAPVSGDLAYSVDEDGAITLSQEQLLSQASDIEGDALTASNLSAGDNATVVENDDGSFTITPDADFNGDIDLSFDISDGTDTVVASADLTVNPVNDLPSAEDKAYTIEEDGSLTFTDEQLLAGASDIDGDDLSVADVSYSGADGVFTDNGDGSYTFSPNENFSGEVELSFSVSDGTDTVDASIDVTVTEVNDPPVAGSTSYQVDEDNVLTFSEEQLLANSSDVEGDVAVQDVSYSGADGILTDNGDGTYSFAPNENFNGDVSLAVTVVDEDGATANTNAAIEVIAVNDPPVAGTTAYTMQEDGVITLSEEQLLANSSDIEGEVSLQDVSYSGDDGFLTDNGDGTFSFAPNPDWNGDISLDVTVIDEEGAIANTNANITVEAVNDAPVARPVSATVAEDGSITLTQDDLLANATDVEGDDLTALNLQTSDPNAEVVRNEDGSFTITPSENFNGDIAFTYDVSDGENVVATELDLEVTPVNDLPTAPTISMEGEEDQLLVIDPAFIVGQSEDLDGDDLSLTNLSIRQPANATVTMQPDGMYHLVAPQDFNGMIELAYQLTDGTETVDGSLNVDVIPVNDAPFTDGNAHMTTSEDGAFTFNAEDMLDLFGDIDTENLIVSRVITTEGEDGGDLTDNGDGTWTFTPTDDFAGTSGLQVVVSDGEEETTLDIPVYVRPVADGAVITTDHEGPLVFSEDTTGHLGLNVDLLDDSEVLSNLVMTGFPVGFVVSDGVNTIEITYEGQYIDIDDWNIDDLQLTPPEDFSGNFFITVTATTVDYGDEGSSALTEPSEAYADVTVEQGETMLLTTEALLEMAEHTEAQPGDEVQFVHLIDDSQGSLIDNGDGTWSFTPADDFTGTLDFAYVINRDGELIDEQAAIGVVPPGEGGDNQAPQVEGIASSRIAEGETLSFTEEQVLSTVTDLDGDHLSLESIQLISGQGTLEQDNEGVYSYTPAEGFTGEAQVGFVATDGQESVRSHFNINVDELSEPLTPDEDGAVNFTQDQLLDEMNIEGDVSSLEVDYLGDEGALIEDGEQAWSFWPDEGFSGDLPLEVSVDGAQPATVNLSVDMPEAEAAPESSASPEAASDDNAEAGGGEVDASDEESFDMEVAPGGDFNLSIPGDVGGADGVESVEITGFPEGTQVSGAIETDGGYMVSGDLSQPVSVNLADDYEGELTVEFAGLDSNDDPVEGANFSINIDVSEDHEMSSQQGAGSGNDPFAEGEGASGGDWTSAEQSDEGVDVMDDSSSFDQGGGAGGSQDTHHYDENV
ncbi:tandem-95 repeat protein [Aliagarivorans marinus]|uniref:tandem-95 repeat protein n=1 Tax=Aliagarivorans marinus TaxID=561965 RepID=UPI0004287C06|nr:tandem-95 repeat protein [Aliagarivorans marinus]